MSRDANGNYTLPSGNPVQTGTTIDSSWANDTMSDLGNEITNSLDRFGKGGMSAPLRGVNGTVTVPSYSFTGETSSGFFLAGAGDFRVTVQGSERARFTASSVLIPDLVSDVTTANTNAINALDTRVTTNENDIGSNTSAISTKAPITNPTFTGNVTIPEFIYHTGDTNTFFGFSSPDTFEVTTGGSERMRINSSGNVGIGTTSPSAKLETSINFGTSAIFRATNTGSGAFNEVIISGGSSSGTGLTLRQNGFTNTQGVNSLILNRQNGSMVFGTNDIERMRIDASGNVGIGTSTPVYALDVVDSASTLQTVRIGCSNTGIGRLLFGDVASANRGNVQYDHTSDSMAFHTVGTERMRIDASGNVGIGTASPEDKLSILGGVVHTAQELNVTRNHIELGSSVSNTFGAIGLTQASADLFLGSDLNPQATVIQRTSGNVGIGTASPSQRLSVTGNIAATGTVTGTNITALQNQADAVDVEAFSTTRTVGAKNKYYVGSPTGTITATISNALAVGTTFTISNVSGSGSINIAAGSGDTLGWYSGAGYTTGTRTLASGGIATVVVRSASAIDIFGAGLS